MNSRFKFFPLKGCMFVGQPIGYVSQQQGTELASFSSKSLNDCIDLCKETNDCNSLTYCQGSTCLLKDKILGGKIVENVTCTTYYRKCDQGRAYKKY